MYSLLEGVSVIELAILVPGATTCQYLADMGADVIKIESPTDGDYLRQIGRGPGGISALWLQINRNKRSLTLDLKRPEGREVAQRLIRTADIVVEGFRPGVARRMGFDYERVRALKPDIVYCALSGFGQTGPYAQMASHGGNLDSPTGGLAITFDAEGRPTIANSWISLATTAGPLLAVAAVLAALAQRHLKGIGQFIDAASSDAALALTAGRIVGAANGAERPDWERQPQARYNVYETRDGKYVIICCIERHFWQNFCRAAGREDLLASEDAQRKLSFAADDTALRAELTALFRTRTQAEWVRLFLEANVAGGPVNRAGEIPQDPHVAARHPLVEAEHPSEGTIRLFPLPVRFEGQTFEVRRPPPRQGQHTAEILAQMGYTGAEIERLRAEKVV
jgi:crotonobetainyl-CoA:carnitine CoA-transferase CaiB-like acyl-CoA transferase